MAQPESETVPGFTVHRVEFDQEEIDKTTKFLDSQSELRASFGIRGAAAIIVRGLGILYLDQEKKVCAAGQAELIARITISLDEKQVMWEWGHSIIGGDNTMPTAPKKEFKYAFMRDDGMGNASAVPYMKRCCAEEYGYDLVEEVGGNRSTNVHKIIGVKPLIRISDALREQSSAFLTRIPTLGSEIDAALKPAPPPA